MSHQHDLWGTGPSVPYQRHSDTSRESAAAEESSGSAATRRARVLELVRESGPRGVTGRELVDRFGGQVTSWHPRLVELEEEGAVVRLERKRANSTGKRAHVYVLRRFMLPDDREAPGPSRRCPHCGGEI